MKLKNIIYSVSLCAAALIPVACDDVAEDDRFIYVEPAEVAKRVLLEDFTGQRCINCPEASELIERLQEEYGADNVIAVGIYGGINGTSSNGTPFPLYTEAGGWYYDHWGVANRPQPFGMVDRQGFIDTSAWPQAVYSNIQKQAEVMLEAECDYDEVSRNVGITVTADGVANIDGSLQVWLVEDSVVSLQFLPGISQPDMDYVHNHVFRATVNGQMGDDISVVQGERVEREFTYEISQDWKPEDMSVVAFIYNDTGVLQTVKAKLIPAQGDENQPAVDNVEGA